MADSNNISSTEYQAFLSERERVKQAMENAESEFMFITYKKLLSVLNKRHEMAVKLNIQLENREIRERAAQKRESFKTAQSA